MELPTIEKTPSRTRRDYMKQIVSCEHGLGRVMFMKRIDYYDYEFFVELFDSNKIITVKEVKKL